MDLTLVAILYTGLFALGLQALMNSGVAGPAGRRRALPRYQRRILFCVTVIVLCVVVDAYLLARGAGVPRPALRGLLTLDVLTFVGLLAAWSALRRDATQASVRWLGLGLGAYGFGVVAVWTLLVFAWTRADGAAFQQSVAAAWGTTPAVLGGLVLVHYLFAPLLLAASIAAHDHWPGARPDEKDRVLQPLAVLSMALAVLYVLFTLAVLSD